MADIKRALSLGGTSAASSLRGILKEFSDSINSSINSISSTVGNGRGGTSSSVFYQPIPGANNSADAGNPMVAQGGGGGGRIGGLTPAGWGNVASVGTQLFRQSIPNTSAGIEQNIIGTRAGFYGYGSGSGANRYNQQQTLALNTMRQGSGLNPMDASRAMMLGQSNGIGMGLSNYNQIMGGVGRMSNLMPGMGIEGSMQAFIASQQPRNVNVMKFMGIMARDPQTGKPVSPDTLASQIWNKISRERKAGSTITKDALATSLLPGGALDSLLNQVTGGDQMLRQQLEAYLYAKASGAKNMSKSELTRVGLRTDYENAKAKQSAEEFRGVSQTSRSAAAGAELGTQFSTAVEAFSNAVDRMTGYKKAGAFKAGFDMESPVSSNSLLGSIPILGSLLKLLPGRASGGDVGQQNAYMVGEKGPELFVPKTDGTIIPNHKLNFAGFRESGGEVFAKNMLSQLGITANADNTAALAQWFRFEGGGGGKATGIGKNSANWNPLNTTLRMDGSKSMNKVGVQSYTSMEQGISATIATLTGKSADARGYTGIIDALKTGDKSAILSAIDNSAWRTGKADGSGAYNWSGSKGFKPTAGGTPSSGTSASSPAAAGAEGGLAAQMAAQVNYRGGGGGGGTTYSAGAIVVNISGAKDPKAIVDELSLRTGVAQK